MGKEPYPSLVLRPFQALCMVCSAGEGADAPKDETLEAIGAIVRGNRDIPVTLRCNAGDVYAYQDPGADEDTPEGAEFNRKRDLDILQKLDLAPGSTLPARTLFNAVLKTITTVVGICSYDAVTSDAWRGCPKAGSGHYEKGLEAGITAIIAPRSQDEMADEKRESLRAMHSAREIAIRPHILLCAACQYGSGVRPPYAEDNLPEFIEMILTEKPDVPVSVARQADWMMCAPCPARVPGLNACVNVLGSGGLSNEKRDLDVLQKLGLTYGSVMPARELYRLIFERIPTTQDICKREGNHSPSVWWDGCGEANCEHGNEDYARARMELGQKLGI